MKEEQELSVPQVNKVNNKDTFYMEFAKLAASKSKDPTTKVGSCLVKDKKVLSIGYNGAPRNFPDCVVPEVSDSSLPLKEQKNTYMVHSEINAILNYGGSLNDLRGAVLYVTVSPCHECAKVIAQVGISKVIYLEEYHRTEMWNMSKYILKLCGVEYVRLED